MKTDLLAALLASGPERGRAEHVLGPPLAAHSAAARGRGLHLLAARGRARAGGGLGAEHGRHLRERQLSVPGGAVEPLQRAGRRAGPLLRRLSEPRVSAFLGRSG